MKKILFVINTFSRAGAEIALLELLKLLASDEEYTLSLFVLMGQGELVRLLPKEVKLENRHYQEASVLEKNGALRMYRTILEACFRHGTMFRLSGYMLRELMEMLKKGHVQPDKLLWRALSDGAETFSQEYDLAVAFLEGGSAYYVADHVKAKKKAAFIHIDYEKAGYTRSLDKDCYLKFDAVFPIGENVKAQFLKVYPECKDRTKIFPNVVNQEEVKRKSMLPGGFSDAFKGVRILTVGRLTEQKSYPVAIEAMRLLKEHGINARWYALGDGAERGHLERLIEAYGLQEHFILLGSTENPYPYYAQTDLYVHATKYEGKSIAVQEAMTLGCAVVVSESSREQVIDGVNGTVCALEAQAVYMAVRELIENPQKRTMYGNAAAKMVIDCEEQKKLLKELLSTTENQ